MRRLLATVAALGCLLAVTGCSEEEPETTGSEGPATIELIIEDGTVTPSGERVEVATGQPVELVIESDVAAEAHVHSDPEQTLQIAEGTSTVTIDPIDKPGVVPVELHDPALTLVQLEVR